MCERASICVLDTRKAGTGRETSFICVMFDCEIFSGRAPHYIMYISININIILR